MDNLVTMFSKFKKNRDKIGCWLFVLLTSHNKCLVTYSVSENMSKSMLM